MAAYADILMATMGRVATLSTGSPTLPVAYPEDAGGFTPPTSGRYLDVAFFSNRPKWEGLSAGRMDQGILQITVVWPKSRGLVAPAQVVDLILAHFAIGAVMRHGTANVKVSGQPYATSPLSDESELRQPITIPWTA
jgi:hypothetical protein